MAAKILISENKIKAFTNINKNVDIDVIKSEILIAQDIELQPLLGSKFYFHLLDQISSTGNTFSVDELELVNEYVAPFLVQVSYWNMLPHLHYRTMNRGVVEGDMESARSVDTETLKYLRSIQKQRSDFYKMRMLDYLITGRGMNKFPDYVSQSTLDGMVPDRTSKYNTPIVLNNTTRNGISYERFNRGNIKGYSDRANYESNCPDCW